MCVLTVVMDYGLRIRVDAGEWRIERIVAAVLDVLSQVGRDSHSVRSGHRVVSSPTGQLFGSEGVSTTLIAVLRDAEAKVGLPSGPHRGGCSTHDSQVTGRGNVTAATDDISRHRATEIL